MAKRRLTYFQLREALSAFGYQERRKGSHSIFQRPQSAQLVVLPLIKAKETASPMHQRLVETTLEADGVLRDDIRFYFEHGKIRKELIQKGDRLIWTDPSTGIQTPAVAASTEEDGMVIIKQKGTFSPCPVDQLTKVFAS